VDILPLIPEIRALVSSGQLDNQSQRSPFTFTTGQILDARVSSQEGPNLFTLKLGGLEIPVETSAQLQAGQSLSVKVTTLSPQLQLQVFDPTTTNQRISTGLHTMINQGAVFSQLSPLTESSPQVSQLSASSQEVLQLMQRNLSGFAPATNQINSLVEQVGASLLNSLSTNSTAISPNNTATVSQLLQQLTSDPALPATLRETAASLANIFSKVQFPEETVQLQANTAPQTVTTAANTDLHQQISALNPSLQAALLPILDRLGQFSSTNEGRAIEQLLTFLIQTGRETTQASPSGFAPATNQTHSLIEQVGASLLNSLSTNNTAISPNTTATVSQLLQQLANDPALSSTLRETAARLANIFSKVQFSEGAVQLQANTAPQTVATAANTDLRQQINALNPSLQAALLPILDQLGHFSSTDAGRMIEQLLRFLIQVGNETTSLANQPADGPRLQQTLHKLGLNLEQLLLQGKTQEAAGTLKFALLELAKFSSHNESHIQQIDELLGSIQFSQLMQMRLSPESLFFLPLPFPYLQSGFLLIEDKADQDGSSAKKKNKNSQDNDIAMYLQLEGLGNLHIAIHQEEEKIALTFYSQDSERAKFIGENREALQQMLTTGNLYSAQFLVGAKEPVKILIEKLLHAPTGMVNTVA